MKMRPRVWKAVLTSSRQYRLVLTAAFAFVVALTGGTAESIQDFQPGHDLVRQRRYDEARTFYTQQLTNRATDVRSLAQLAIAQSYVMEGKLAEAMEAYQALPPDAPAHHRWEATERTRQLDRRLHGMPEWDPAESRTHPSPLPSPDVIYHVSPVGSASADGSNDAPFATLEQARDAIRSSPGRPTNSFQVVIHGGEYRVTQTFKLDAADSGTELHPIVYRAAPGEHPLFRGGSKLHDLNVAKSPRLPAEVQGKVYEADLRQNGVTNLLPLLLGGFASGNGFSTHPAHELFFNGRALQLARGPNQGFLNIKDVAVKDGTRGYDREGSKVGKFLYDGDRLARWKSEPDLLLYGYWFWDWADSYERVTGIDSEHGVISLAEPFHTYGYSRNAPFYAINALSELDHPGEWYLDRENLRVYFYPPANIEGATLELSLFDRRMVEIRGASFLRLEGLTWELGSADGLFIENGRDVLIAGCTIRHLAGDGLVILGGKHHGVLGCDIYSLGRGGTKINGGDRKRLSPGEHYLENCDIHNLSRIDHTYTPAIVLDGVGNRVAHNRFSNIPSSALRVGGNDHIIEFNEVFNVVTESDDQGGADMFGNPTYRGNIYRFNHWHHIGNWNAKGENPKCGQAGIRLDDAICGTLIYGNIFERCSSGQVGFGGIQIHGGKDNIIDNNFFIACSAAISFSAWDDPRWVAATKSALQSTDIDSQLYLQRYPELAHLTESANLNHVWRNRTALVGEMFRRRASRVAAMDNLSLDCCKPSDEIPGFAPIPHPLIGLYTDHYRKTVTTRNP